MNIICLNYVQQKASLLINKKEVSIYLFFIIKFKFLLNLITCITAYFKYLIN